MNKNDRNYYRLKDEIDWDGEKKEVKEVKDVIFGMEETNNG